ncbi:hypothetical protein AB1N83_011997 [Pleurotus pulmonarius]
MWLCRRILCPPQSVTHASHILRQVFLFDTLLCGLTSNSTFESSVKDEDYRVTLGYGALRKLSLKANAAVQSPSQRLTKRWWRCGDDAVRLQQEGEISNNIVVDAKCMAARALFKCSTGTRQMHLHTGAS